MHKGSSTDRLLFFLLGSTVSFVLVLLIDGQKKLTGDGILNAVITVATALLIGYFLIRRASVLDMDDSERRKQLTTQLDCINHYIDELNHIFQNSIDQNRIFPPLDAISKRRFKALEDSVHLFTYSLEKYEIKNSVLQKQAGDLTDKRSELYTLWDIHQGQVAVPNISDEYHRILNLLRKDRICILSSLLTRTH